ncbi:GNAT family N-acetyltransferase [Terricaulis sp.]|uniref:GNAT family N-acetyltransferase n=1 Tax=Terricaulis sp. TaxID=2768686 RepID=UPI00378453B6
MAEGKGESNMREITGISIEPLASRLNTLQTLSEWFELEWPAYYGAGGPGDARRDLETYANQGNLPTGVVALHAGAVCGVAVLKADSIASHRHLSPWAAAGLVKTSMRGQGVGRLLLAALEDEARKLGFDHIYCGTSTAENLLRRCGWRLLERIDHEGEPLGIYAKAL